MGEHHGPAGPAQVPKPAHDLAEAVARMRWREERQRFALIGFGEPPEPADLELLRGAGPAQLVREGGETTLLVPAERATGILARHPGARCQSSLVWIRFEAEMGWEVVGFLALVAGRLAGAGIPLGAVCGYSRDHLFVAEEHRDAARRALAALFPEAPAAAGG